MKRTTIILFLIFCLCSCSKGLNNPDEAPSFPDKDKIHILTPDSRGRLDMNSKESGEILPGDIIYLRGEFSECTHYRTKRDCRTTYPYNKLPGRKIDCRRPGLVGRRLFKCAAIIGMPAHHTWRREGIFKFPDRRLGRSKGTRFLFRNKSQAFYRQYRSKKYNYKKRRYRHYSQNRSGKG